MSNEWTLVEHHFYYLKVSLFDNEKDLIDLTDNLVFELELSSEFFEIINQNNIRSEFVVKTKKATEPREKTNMLSYLKRVKSEIETEY